MHKDRINKEFLGQGIAFPFQFAPHGGVALAKGEQDIVQSIKIILSTSPGERRMRPEFGCRIHELTFASRDATTKGLLIYYVEQALGRWEPRIEVQEVTVETDSDNPYLGTWFIEIKYRVKSTHDERSIIYPFYLMGEA